MTTSGGDEPAEEALRRVMREQEVLLESVPVGIMHLSRRTVVWVNRGMEEIFQYTRDEMVGQTTRKFYLTQEEFESYGAESASAMARTATFETESASCRKDGTRIWIKIRGRFIDPDDVTKGSLWIVSDHTARRRVDEALRRSEARFRGLFMSHTAVLLLVDPEDGAVVDANPAAESFYGYDRDTLLSKRAWDINPASEPALRETLRAAAQRAKSSRVTTHRLADGDVRAVEVHTSPVEVDGRTLLFAIVVDITARQDLEQALSAQQRELEALNRSLEARIQQSVAELRAKDQLLFTQNRHAAMGEVVGHIAHQWRQPLNALGLVLSNLRDDARAGALDADDVERAVAHGQRLIHKMSSTINDFRDYARPERERQPFSALAQVRQTVALLDATFRAAGITVFVEADDDARLFGFANEYSQVLLNLLANAREAIQAARDDGGAVTLRLERVEGFGRLTVRDDGGGVPEAIAHKLFEPYFSTRPGGTGIGLYMSRQIVERSLGGRLETHNVPGGAAFVVWVPLAPA